MTYSNSLSTSRQRFAARNQNAVSFRSQGRTLGPVSNTILLIVLACLLGLLYLTQATKTNTYTYRLNEVQTKAAQLKDEHSELEVSSARLQALERVKNSDVAKNLVTIAPTTTLQN